MGDVMPLIDTLIRNTKPKKKPFSLSDGGGLYLLVNPNASKWWRLKYYYQKKERLLSLGVYPSVSLKEARKRREEAKALLAAGTDPGEQRKQAKTAALLAKNNEQENLFEPKSVIKECRRFATWLKKG